MLVGVLESRIEILEGGSIPSTSVSYLISIMGSSDNTCFTSMNYKLVSWSRGRDTLKRVRFLLH